MLEASLKEAGLADEQVQKAVKAAAELVEHSKTPGFYDHVVVSTLQALETAIYGPGTESATKDGDVAMGDAAPKKA